MTRFTNLTDGCREYIGILNSRPNGLGQQIGPEGLSRNTLAKLVSQFGNRTVDAELDRQFTELHQSKVATLLAEEPRHDRS